jgi:hypothetical protein
MQNTQKNIIYLYILLKSMFLNKKNIHFQIIDKNVHLKKKKKKKKDFKGQTKTAILQAELKFYQMLN